MLRIGDRLLRAHVRINKTRTSYAIRGQGDGQTNKAYRLTDPHSERQGGWRELGGLY